MYVLVLLLPLAVAQSQVVDIKEVAKNVITSTMNAFNNTKNVDSTDQTRESILGELVRASVKIQELGGQVHMSIGTNTIEMLAQGLEQHARLELRLDRFLDLHSSIDNQYRTFDTYIRNSRSFEFQTLINYVDSTVLAGGSGSVGQTLDTIFSYVVPSRKGVNNRGLLHLLAYHLQNTQGELFCNSGQSPQQILHSIYNSLILTELKGFVMTQFGYAIKRSANQGSFVEEANHASERFHNRTQQIMQAVRQTMTKLSREFWKCDPRTHVLGKTYDQFSQLLQGYIENIADLNSERSCFHGCASYERTKSHGCYYGLCNLQRQCRGEILDCRRHHNTLWMCPADAHSHRRYDFVEFGDGEILGKKHQCDAMKATAWTRGFVKCNYCFCLCDEQGAASDRYVSLRPVTSDYLNNKVVTGLRLIKHNRIIHLQVQEGLLQARGNIATSTVRWVPVSDFKIDQNSIDGFDYHTLTQAKRALDLDDVVAEAGYVVTGVRFSLIGTHLNFAIQTTPFDFDTGTLIDPHDRSAFKNNPRTVEAFQSKRSELKVIAPDVPILSPHASVPVVEVDRYIKFVNSDVEKDAAQTTVPFFDVQPVESLQPVPLSGAGIYYKGRRNFGGFVAPKVITYDFSKHLRIALPEMISERVPNEQFL